MKIYINMHILKYAFLCLLFWVVLLVGCAAPEKDDGYIVEPDRWPDTGWYWNGRKGD